MSFIKKQGFQFFIFFGIFALIAGIAHAEVSAETQYVFNTFLFLVCGFLVMFMAAGFAMLEAGSVRSKNAAAICIKNISLVFNGWPALLARWLQPHVWCR